MKTFRFSVALLLLAQAVLLSHSAMADSAVMSLVDQSGVSLSARLISCDGTAVTVIRESDKKTFSIPLARLEKSSQDSIKTWMDQGGNRTEKFSITVDTAKTRRTTGAEDFDDKRVNLDPLVTIRNPDVTQTAAAAKVTVLFLGKPVIGSGDYFVFKKASFDLPELRPLGSQEFSPGKISAAYDNRGYAKFGSRYSGYVVLIHDKGDTRILSSTSVPAPVVTTHGLKLLTLTEGGTYDRDLKTSAISGR